MDESSARTSMANPEESDWEVTSSGTPPEMQVCSAPPVEADSTETSMEPMEEPPLATPSSPVLLSQPIRRGEADPDSTDGDVRFKTINGEIILAHSLVLGRASPLFRHYGKSSPRTVIPLQYTSGTLNIVLDLLYPCQQSPTVASTPELIEVLHLVKELKISSLSAHSLLNELIKLESHPLRSWALATAFGYCDAQRAAAKRYFALDSASFDEVPEELRLVDAFQIVQLDRSKARAIEAARQAMLRIDFVCGHCCEDELPADQIPRSEPMVGKSKKSIKPRASWAPVGVQQVAWWAAPVPATDSQPRNAYLARSAKLNPFLEATSSQLLFEVCYLEAADDQQCGLHGKRTFPQRRAEGWQNLLRQRLHSILTTELETLSTFAPEV